MRWNDYPDEYMRAVYEAEGSDVLRDDGDASVPAATDTPMRRRWNSAAGLIAAGTVVGLAAASIVAYAIATGLGALAA